MKPPPDISTVSFGCRLNLVETEAMRAAARAAGFNAAILVNTCAVTAESVRQAHQTIRRLARENPGAKIIVSGCAAQIDRAGFEAMPEVAHVLGNARKTEPEVWRALARGEKDLSEIMQSRPAAPLNVERIAGHTRAFLAIQNGCDHRCTFCVIPFGRGPSRSLPAGLVVEQAQRLVDAGHQEIVLTGVDLTSWGADLPGAPKLGRLTRQILKFTPGLKRLRLSSLDCIEADADLFAALAEEERLTPHLHLSLQAGDDLVLKRMKRRHNRAEAIAFCAQVRRLRPDIVFGADLIAGFPTEDEEMAANSLRLVEECGLTHLHVFPFSARAQTPAARMPQTPRPLVAARAKKLRMAGQAALIRHLDAQIGRRVEILTERGESGRTRDFTQVHTPGRAAGLTIQAVVDGHDGRRLTIAAD